MPHTGKLGSQLASAEVLAGPSPAFVAVLRSSERVGSKERGVPDCERVQSRLRDPTHTQCTSSVHQASGKSIIK